MHSLGVFAWSFSYSIEYVQSSKILEHLTENDVLGVLGVGNVVYWSIGKGQ
jgi:hypothetical protein